MLGAAVVGILGRNLTRHSALPRRPEDRFGGSGRGRCPHPALPPGTPPLLTPGRDALFTYTNSATPPTQPPELKRRMDAAGVKAPLRFACRVEDVVREQERRTIKCGSPVVRARRGDFRRVVAPGTSVTLCPSRSRTRSATPMECCSRTCDVSDGPRLGRSTTTWTGITAHRRAR